MKRRAFFLGVIIPSKMSVIFITKVNFQLNAYRSISSSTVATPMENIIAFIVTAQAHATYIVCFGQTRLTTILLLQKVVGEVCPTT